MVARDDAVASLARNKHAASARPQPQMEENLKKIFAVILLYAVCSLTLAVDPAAIRALERDLAGGTPVFDAQATRGNGHSRLVLTLAGFAMIGTGTWLMATSKETEVVTLPAGGGTVPTYKTLHRETRSQGRLFGGIGLAGVGGILVWQGLRK